MGRGVTQEQVSDAARRLVAAGEDPTVERVRQVLGTGSPNTVGPMLKIWRLKVLQPLVQGAMAEGSDWGVPEAVVELARRMWSEAQRQAAEDLAGKLKTAELEAQARCAAADKDRDAAVTAARAAEERMAQEALRAQGAEQVVRELREQLSKLEESRKDDQRREQQQQQALAREAEAWRKEAAAAKEEVSKANHRADAADRRVAMELERERQARVKALEAADAERREWSHRLGATSQELEASRRLVGQLTEAVREGQRAVAELSQELADVRRGNAELAGKLDAMKEAGAKSGNDRLRERRKSRSGRDRSGG